MKQTDMSSRLSQKSSPKYEIPNIVQKLYAQGMKSVKIVFVRGQKLFFTCI